MKELLLKRKKKFATYLIAAFMFNIDYMMQTAIMVMIMAGIEKGDTEYYKGIAIVAMIMALYSGANFYVSRMLRIGYMRDTILDVRKHAFDKIINMSYRRFSKKSKEVYISNLINDVNNFEDKFFVSLLNLLIDGSMSVIYMIVIFVVDYKLGFIMLVIAAILSGLGLLFTNRTEKLHKEVSTANEEFTTDISNTFNGIEILKLNGIEDRFLNKSLSMVKRLESKKQAFNIYSDIQRKIIYSLAFSILVIVLIYEAMAMSTGDASVAEVTLIFQISSTLCFNLVGLLPLWNVTKSSSKIYEKITKDEDGEEDSVVRDRNFDFNDKIEVRNVSFSYDSRTILENASFTIEKGKKYLIKGASGAGKSTLMKLLSQTYDNYTGSILVDGVELKNIKEKTFNEKVAFIYQDVFLFEDTIRENITLYHELDDRLIDFAVKASGLNEVIENRKDGINEMLSENGKNLSGGQRQRISIARAIAKQAEILFVDEGTSSLNGELGRDIEKVFLGLDSTLISISHRFYEGVTDKYDYVLEIKNGKVSAFPAKDYFGEAITW